MKAKPRMARGGRWGWNSISPYPFAIICLGAAFAIRFALHPLLQEHGRFILFVPAIMLSAWRGGIGPAVLSAATSTLLATCFSGVPFCALPSFDIAHFVSFLIYVFCALFVILLMNSIRKHSAELESEVKKRDILEADLRQSEERFRNLFAFAAVGIVQLDPQGRFLDANKKFCNLIGFTLAELKSRKVFDFVLPEDREMDAALFGQMVSGEVCVLDRQKRYIRKDGKIVWAQVTATALYDADGRPTSSITVVEEITARVEAEAALQRAQSQLARHAAELEHQVARRTAALHTSLKDMQSFCYTIAHDLRAPLRAMNGFTTALLDDCSDRLNQDDRMYCVRVAAAAARMDDMISGLLEYGRLSHLDPKIEPLDLRKQIERVLADAADQIRERNAAVVVENIETSVCGNPVLLRQVLNNILTNALKFIVPENTPQIRIFTEKQGQCLRLFVEDNGIGIQGTHQQRIFSPFERLSPSYPGTGIGLTIAKKAMEKMGGSIGVRPAAPSGSCFWIELSSHNQCPCEERLCAALAV